MDSKFEIVLSIDGMTCASCSSTIENCLKKNPLISEPAVSLATNTAKFFLNTISVEKSQKVDDITNTIEDIGFGATVLSVDEIQVQIPTLEPEIFQAIFAVDGMTCSSCTSTVESCTKKLTGVIDVNVNLSTGIAKIEFLRNLIQEQVIKNAIEDVGFDVEILEMNKKEVLLLKSDSKAPKSTKKTFLLHFISPVFTRGSTDASSLALCEALTKKLGIISVEPQAQQRGSKLKDRSTVRVLLDEDLAGPRDLLHTLLELGLGGGSVSTQGAFMQAERLASQQQAETRKHLMKFLVGLVLTIPILLITMALPMYPGPKERLMAMVFRGVTLSDLLLFVLATPVEFGVGYSFHTKAWKAFRAGSLGMDFLISTGTLAAYLYSCIALARAISIGMPLSMEVEYFETAAVLITVVVMGKYMETYAKGRTASAIHKLTSQRATTARLIRSEVGIGGQFLTDSSLSSLEAQLTPEQAPLPSEGTSESDCVIPGSLVHIRDHLRLVEGESIPADGILLSGHVGVDESMMTGESIIISKSIGDKLFGGTVVVEGTAEMQVQACGDDSTLGKILSAVQQAQSSKPPIQELADEVARIFVPCIAVVSLVTFIVWLASSLGGVVPHSWFKIEQVSIGGASFVLSFTFALTVWVSACPCAFGLATPTAILVSTGVAARNGMLIRRGAALQHASEVDTICFDKTGTLTQGQPIVTDFHFHQEIASSGESLPNSSLSLTSEFNLAQSSSFMKLPSNPSLFPSLPIFSGDQKSNPVQFLLFLFDVLGNVESRSSHPLAKGLSQYCKDSLSALRQLAPTSPCNNLDEEGDALVEIVPGKGIKASLSSRPADAPPSSAIKMNVLVGNAELLRMNSIDLPESALKLASSLKIGGKVCIFVAVDGKLLAVVGIADTVRPESAWVIQQLARRRLACYMVTGDDRVTAIAIGTAIAIPTTHILANAKPSDKEHFISSLQRQGRKVLFVGDGTNDSPALAKAEVGVVMSSGTEIAIESGDVVFCKNSIDVLPTLIDLSVKTLRRIKMNYFWALIYNVALVPIAAGVLYPSYHFALSPMLAGIAMGLSSVSIVLSSLMLGLFKPSSLYKPVSASLLDLIVDDCDCPASKANTEPPAPDNFDLLCILQFILNAFSTQGSVTGGKGQGSGGDDDETESFIKVVGPEVESVLAIEKQRAEEEERLQASITPSSPEADGLSSQSVAIPSLDPPSSSAPPLETPSSSSRSDKPLLSDTQSSSSTPRNRKKGCGCGKTNCRCGSGCQCGHD